MSLDNRAHEYHFDVNCEQMKNLAADFCLPGQWSRFPLCGSVWRSFQVGQPALIPSLTSTWQPQTNPCTLMGNYQLSGTSQWQLSPSACCCWQLLKFTCSYKVVSLIFPEVYSCLCYLLWVLVFDTVTQMQNACLSTCPWLTWIPSVCSLWQKNSLAFFSVVSILLQDTGNTENPRKRQWCGAIMVVTDRVEATDSTAQESLWFSYLKRIKHFYWKEIQAECRQNGDHHF